MDWSDAFLSLVLCHLVGDFLLQTDHQARLKQLALVSGDPERRRALFAHLLTYTVAFVPFIVWSGGERGLWVAALAIVAIALPHGVQDGLPVVSWWGRRVKGLELSGGLAIAVDQCFHLIALAPVALALAP